MEVTGQLYTSATLLPRETASGTNWIGGCVGPRVGLDSMKRKSCTAGNRTPAVQPVAIPTEISRLLMFRERVYEKGKP
jgi:hypothetical protein